MRSMSLLRAKAFAFALVAFLTTAGQTSSDARPAPGVHKDPPGPKTKYTNPDAYTRMPERTAGTMGLAVVPTLTADSDDAERAIHDLVGQIPGISMSITLNKKEPLYLFKFLKSLKDKGKKVDLLFIGGHSVQHDKTGETLYINLGGGGQLAPAAVDVEAMQGEIKKLAANASNSARVKQLCDDLNVIRAGSAAMAPGATLIVHSCYLGSSNPSARAFLRALGTAVLGVNGGTVIGPEEPIGSRELGDNSPQSVMQVVGATMVTRSVQLCQSLKSRKFLKPGEAFVSTNFYGEMPIAKNAIASCAACDKKGTAGWKDMVGLWRADTGAIVRITQAGNELTVTSVKVANNKFQIKPGDVLIHHLVPSGEDSVHSNSARTFAKVGHKLKPHENGTADFSISSDGKKITGKRTLAQYYDGSTSFDAGETTMSLDWTRIGD